jgi:heme/copper-type cytochrome/quinol oxidase subunit 3
MIRIGLTEIALFATPFVLYATFLWASRTGALDADSWPISRLVALAVVSFLLVASSFVYFANHTGAPPGVTYVPAHMENGKLVPGTTQQ